MYSIETSDEMLPDVSFGACRDVHSARRIGQSAAGSIDCEN
jgi:hypothetical protein